MPYLIKSLKSAETMIEVTDERGNNLFKPIIGMGATYSNTVTEDMRAQKGYKYIDYEFIPPKNNTDILAAKDKQDKKQEKKQKEVQKDLDQDTTLPEMEISEILAKQDQFEAKKKGEANPPPKDLSDEEYQESLGRNDNLYAVSDYKRMKKAELVELIGEHKLDISENKTKVDIIAELVKHEIPKA